MMRILLFLWCLALFQCTKKESLSTANTLSPPTLVDVLIASKQPFNKEIEANGTVLAKEYVELHPEMSGRVVYLNIPEGGMVKQGEVLVKINNADLEAQLKGQQEQLNLAEKTEKRLSQLVSINGVNQSDYDAAANQVATLRATVAYTKAMLDKTVIKAPFSGTVGLRQISPGAYVTPATIVATLQQTDELKIDFTIPEGYAKEIRKGIAVEVALDEKLSKRFKANIIAIEPQVSTTTRNVKIRSLLQSGKTSPGSFVKVYVKQSGRGGSIMIPGNAIIPEDQSKTIILCKNGKGVFTKITTGERQTGLVEVLSGISEGDSVVVSGVLFVRPNAELKVKKVKTIEELNKPL